MTYIFYLLYLEFRLDHKSANLSALLTRMLQFEYLLVSRIKEFYILIFLEGLNASSKDKQWVYSM